VIVYLVSITLALITGFPLAVLLIAYFWGKE